MPERPGEPVDTATVAAFVRRQGTARTLLTDPTPLDDAATSSCTPPAAARGTHGLRLPTGLAAITAVPFPSGRARVDDAGDLLGAVLLHALGLQRREDDHHYADHRALASGRAAYPVHAFVLDRHGARYLDPYRHALVDLDLDLDPDEPWHLGAGSAYVVLAARYGDLPAGYGSTRASVTEAELGMAARALFCSAELFGVVATVVACGPAVERADRLVAASGPGVWSAPVVLTLDGVTPRPGTALEAVGGDHGVGDSAIAADRFASSTHEIREVSATRLTTPAVRSGPRRPAADPLPAGTFATTWADVGHERSSGRAPGGRHGFALRPTVLTSGCLDDLAAWAAVPPVEDSMRTVWDLLTIRVAAHRVTGRPDGLHRLVDGALTLETAGAEVLTLLHRRGGQATDAEVAISTRHAALAWVLSADVDAVLDRVGPAGWSLLQLTCGWVLHGLALASSAHGLTSRPTRSYDEHSIAHALGLPRRDTPLFMNICGRSAYDPPVLDLRP